MVDSGNDGADSETESTHGMNCRLSGLGIHCSRKGDLMQFPLAFLYSSRSCWSKGTLNLYCCFSHYLNIHPEEAPKLQQLAGRRAGCKSEMHIGLLFI